MDDIAREMVVIQHLSSLNVERWECMHHFSVDKAFIDGTVSCKLRADGEDAVTFRLTVEREDTCKSIIVSLYEMVPCGSFLCGGCGASKTMHVGYKKRAYTGYDDHIDLMQMQPPLQWQPTVYCYDCVLIHYPCTPLVVELGPGGHDVPFYTHELTTVDGFMDNLLYTTDDEEDNTPWVHDWSETGRAFVHLVTRSIFARVRDSVRTHFRKECGLGVAVLDGPLETPLPGDLLRIVRAEYLQMYDAEERGTMNRYLTMELFLPNGMTA